MLIASTLSLAACAGNVGSTSAGSDAGLGVEVGASAGEYQEALADMAETTLTYQPSAQSPTSIDANRAVEFKKRVEDLSGGKIEIDILYGQSVVGFTEVDDALVDGRLDIGYFFPKDEPNEYPATDAFVAATSLTTDTPRAGLLASNAALTELAWKSDEILSEFRSKGLHVLTPVEPEAVSFATCNEPGAQISDWEGRQVRIGASSQLEQVAALGSSPVSLAFTEVYEALQRNTVACTVTPFLGAAMSGTLEVAPHYSHSTKASFARGSGALLAGGEFNSLPLAAKQLIFDQMGQMFAESRRSNLAANQIAAEVSEEQAGSYETIEGDAEEALIQATQQSVDEHIEDGTLDPDFQVDYEAAYEKWLSVVEELGLGDEGDYADFNEWHVDEDADIDSFAAEVFSDLILPNRPQ